MKLYIQQKKENPRLKRIAEEVRSVLSEVVSRGDLPLEKPLSDLPTFTQVEVSPDIQHARVFVTAFNLDILDQVVEELNSCANYFRYALGKKLKTKYTPSVKFISDRSGDYALKIDAIFHKIQSKDESN